jgi:serine/threonine protein kinase
VPTPADRLLVDLAVKNHLITKAEGDAALAALPAGTDAGAWLVQKNLIKDRHLASLQKKLEKALAEQGTRADGGLPPQAAASDATFVAPEPSRAPLASQEAGVVLFGQIAVRQGMLSEQDLERALRLQEQLAAQKTPMRLGAILVRARRLTNEQVMKLLEFQEKFIWTCGTCSRRYNVSTSQQAALTCPACGGQLTSSASGITVAQTHPGAGGKPLAPLPTPASGVQTSMPTGGERHAPSPDDPAGLLGLEWRGYKVEKVLGKGGMGAVYKATQTSLRRKVALKVMLRGAGTAAPGERERFEREAKLVAKLNHSNIVPIYDAWWGDDLCYFTMELVDGQDMKTLLRSGTSPIRRGAELVAKAARAMDFAHKKGVIHRDLKPQNIMIADESGEPKILDFGLAKQISKTPGQTEEQQLTQMGAFLGTPSYMAPEQAGGDPSKIDHRADVYALAAILYEVLTGRPPFTGKKAIQVIRSVLKDEPVPPRQVFPQAPAELEAIALKGLRKLPEERYQSAGELADAIEAVIGKVSRSVTAAPEPAPGTASSSGGASSGTPSSSSGAAQPGSNPDSGTKRRGLFGGLFGGGG